MDSFHLINLFFKILAVLTSAARIVNQKKYNNHITTIQLSKINFYKIQISQTTQIKTTKITSTSSKQNKTQNNHLNHLNLNIKHLQKNSYMVLYSIKHQNFIIFSKKLIYFSKKKAPGQAKDRELYIIM
jgi:hypothetical protein